MDTMVVQIEPMQPGPFEPFGPWLQNDPRLQLRDVNVGISTTVLQACTAFPALKERQATLTAREETLPTESRPSTPTPRTASAVPPRLRLGAAASTVSSSVASTDEQTSPAFTDLTRSLSSFTFDRVITPPPTPFTFAPDDACSASSDAQSYKRYRPSTDVDGPNTGPLSCKKRRLRRDLITSRLSQPFSLPATHILNREAVASGDKRLLKLAAVINARRVAAQHAPPMHPGANEMLRRAAIINRFRLRVCLEAEQRGDARVATVAANAGLLQFSVGSRFPGMPVGTGGGGQPGLGCPAPRQLLPLPLPSPIPPQSHPHPLSRAAVVARSSPPGSPNSLRPLDRSSPAGLKLPSPRLIPIPNRDFDDDEVLDDDECAFPGTHLDEPDDVYADFSVIFGGGGGGGPGSDSDPDEEGFEDYLDDLDGIPQRVR